MRRFFSIFMIGLLFWSCGDDLQDNTPSIQGIQNGEILWKASGYNVQTSGNLTTITATTNTSTLQLIIPSISAGTYILNSSSNAMATFEENGVFYSTANDGTGSPVYVSDGMIDIESIGGGNNAITGTFMFNAFDDSGQLTVNFIDGVIFRIQQ
ncbi:MAG: hypothetical protein KJO49_10765 [Bacteroidia bacterium]|nr:hypothetical protein [Bacteroidia bacterium]MBT8269857.1 hypothetical protein [Bacteroidia bacterium]NNF82984.1 hypothetical protein [Flavobacteriaceae bacterium]NNK69331.1 hypothetical protein [Flavobacteriaceae bacterium]NNL80934.1 hypothetical protein [Flavobacteriaceae bacterium]